MAVHREGGIIHEDPGVPEVSETALSEVVREGIGALCGAMGIRELHHGGVLTTIRDARTRAESDELIFRCARKSPVNVLFWSMGPLDQSGQCVSVAADGTREKMVDPATGRSTINLQFYRSRTCYRNSGVNDRVGWLDFAMHLDHQLLTPAQAQSHVSAITSLEASYGSIPTVSPGYRGGAFSAKFYDPYASLFVAYQTSPIVVVAKINGLEPLFLAKNLLFRRNYEKTRWDLESIDKGALTSLVLVGFRGRNADGSVGYLWVHANDQIGVSLASG
jgi:hypothetical protein